MIWRRWLLTAGGVLATALGLVGVFVPLLPTTPFLLLAAACFARSSPRLHRWLLGHHWFGPYIRVYREHHAITRRARAFTLTLLWVSLAYAAVFHATAWWLRGLLVAIGAGVTVHLARLRTLTADMLVKRAATPDEAESGRAGQAQIQEDA